MSVRLKKIYVDEAVVSEELTRRIVERNRDIPIEVIRSGAPPEDSDSFSEYGLKRILYITADKGQLVKPCPGTQPPYICCRYTVINQTLQCPMDCSYCILQMYLNRSFITLYANLSDVFEEITILMADEPHRFFRFGTGELTDSLALDWLTGLSKDFTAFFSTKRNTVLELKTKTACVEELLDCPTKNIVVSWSLNPQEIVDREELYAAGVADRLRAARDCQDRGFLLGFHFDPILCVPDWERLYGELIDHIFTSVDGTRIAWFSLGSLRYPPDLYEIVVKRFPKHRIFLEEMIRGLDGKMRYPKPLRIEMYRAVYRRLKERAPDLFVYFCMESPEVWDRVMGNHPKSNEELDFWFADSLFRRFPELDMDEPRREAYWAFG
ncbi:MAG: spore photoproduct lyase family protein [bacterium]